MGKGRSLVISMIAVVVSAALVYGLYHLQLNKLAEQKQIGVVVAKRFLAAGEMITGADVELRYLPQAAYSGEMLQDIQAAVGLETLVPIGQQEPIVGWRLNYHHLQPRKSESTFQIPKEYIRSISNGIRAGDRVIIYVSGDEVSRRLFEQTVIVASVKSSGNVEVDSMEQSHLMSLAESNQERMYAARRDANAMIEYLNLNLTEQQWLELDELCKDGTAKLIVAYSPESFSMLQSEAGKGADMQ
ncbi:SAF domain-containing protein [Paenibacillus sp. IITD108]|uniref:SAF domain-containing protein n=1 Tax=Paenibacillus sp. IITD108 TaxID=3116649 RepID=UPI002F41FF3B